MCVCDIVVSGVCVCAILGLEVSGVCVCAIIGLLSVCAIISGSEWYTCVIVRFVGEWYTHFRETFTMYPYTFINYFTKVSIKYREYYVNTIEKFKYVVLFLLFLKSNFVILYWKKKSFLSFAT